jgi:hypothetical protein
MAHYTPFGTCYVRMNFKILMNVIIGTGWFWSKARDLVVV